MLDRNRTSVGFIVAGLTAIVQCGCVMGPRMLQASRAPYNEVIQRTTAEQLLLNLVRLKYRETPVFLEVGSVSAQFVFNQSADIGGTLNENIPFQPINPDVLRLGAGGGYQERPTITYTPLQGKDFVNRLMSPLSIETVLLLTRTGWRIDRVLPLTVQSMNGLENGTGASGPTPSLKPQYKDFFALASLLSELQSRGALELGARTTREPLSHPISADRIDAADNPSVTTGCNVTTRPIISLLYVTSCKNLFVLDQNGANLIDSVCVLPDAGHNVVNGVHNVAITVVTEHTVRSLRGVAHNWDGGIYEEI